MEYQHYPLKYLPHILKKLPDFSLIISEMIFPNRCVCFKTGVILLQVSNEMEEINIFLFTFSFIRERVGRSPLILHNLNHSARYQ